MASNGNKGAPKGRSGTGRFAGFNPQVGSEQYMLIVADNSDLAEFVDDVYYQIDALVRTRGGEFSVTEEEFRSYFATALKVRVEHTTRPRWSKLGFSNTGMSVDEGWALPVPLHDVLSSVGRVSFGQAELRIWPLWAKESDHLVLPEIERDRITLEIRAACTTVGIRTFAEMSKDIEGHPQTMVLVWLPQREMWVSQSPFEVQDAAKSMYIGARPVTEVHRGAGGADYEVVDIEQVAAALTQMPLWVPGLRMERNVVVRYSQEMARIAG